MKLFLKTILAWALCYSGALRVFKWFKKKETRILCYHGISDRPNLMDMFMDVDLFEAQMAFLKENHHPVITLDEAASTLKEKPVRDQYVVTFDDGYEDNFSNAYPILKRLNLPATVFLTTDNVDQGWPTAVEIILLCVENTQKSKVFEENPRVPPLSLFSFREKREAALVLDKIASSLYGEEKEAFINEVVSEFGFKRSDPLLQNRMVTWDQVREMEGDIISIGGHTKTHPILSRLDNENLKKEIQGSRERIQEKTGKTPRHFAYPFGYQGAVSREAEAAVKNAGYESAVVLYPNPVNEENRHRLGRTMVSQGMVRGLNGRFSKTLFACELSGIFDLIFFRQ